MDVNEAGPVPDKEMDPFTLNEDQGRALLGIARRAITLTANNDRVPLEELEDDSLQQKAGVFVTLWKKQQAGDLDLDGFDQLRGCIGRLKPDFPLSYAVNSAAISAATRDPRFSPLTADELDKITIEVAVLTPLEEIESLEEIVIGRDGIVIEAMGRRGLLLPKVAPRMNWDRSDFLENVCLKAGLPPKIWPGEGQLFRFTTTEFRE